MIESKNLVLNSNRTVKPLNMPNLIPDSDVDQILWRWNMILLMPELTVSVNKMKIYTRSGTRISGIVIYLFIISLASCHVQLPQKYNQKTLTEANVVDNHKDNYVLHLENGDPQTNIYVSTADDTGKFISIADWQGKEVTLKRRQSRPFFTIAGKQDSVLVANRLVDFEKVTNFRDLGGIKTQDGRMVKWGRIFRSGNLSGLKKNEFDKFKDLDIPTVYDLRTSHEIDGKEDRLPVETKYIHAPTVKDNEGQIAQLRAKVIAGKISEMEAREQTAAFYKDAVSVNVGSLRDIIGQIARSEQPVLYHCSAGKDRTGIVSALILSILNVDRKTIMDEYLMSNYYRRKKTEKLLGKARLAKIIKPRMNLKAIEVFMTVDAEFMNAVFEVIDKEYGGTDKFIKNQLQINQETRNRIISSLTV